MSAVDVIKQNLDVEKILEYYDAKEVRHYGSYIRCCCPIHKGDNPTAFVMQKEKGLWSCKTGDCGDGDVFILVQQMEGINFIESVNKVAEILGINIENLEIVQKKDELKKELEEFRKYINNKKKDNKEFDEFELNVETKTVKKFRNFKEETLKHFGLLYVKEIELEKKAGGTFTMRERLAIPIIVNGITVGYSLRKLKASDNPKWFHAPHTIETGEILYNLENCTEDEPIIVCEGMFDVWAWYEAGFKNVVCTFGAHLSDKQYRLLLKTGKDVIWSYDNDSAGIIARDKATKQFKYKANQWYIDLPEGKDPCDCEREQLQELHKNKVRILEWK